MTTKIKIWIENKISLGVWCKRCGSTLTYEETYSTMNPYKSYCPKRDRCKNI